MGFDATPFESKTLKDVYFLGPKAPEDLREEIQKATICVFPSFAEAFPLSWLEAMAMEKAVVASNIGWGTEIINHGVDGFLTHPKDHDQFAQYIIELINNTDLTRQLGKNARKSAVNKFSHNLVAHQSLEFYKTIIPNA